MAQKRFGVALIGLVVVAVGALLIHAGQSSPTIAIASGWLMFLGGLTVLVSLLLAGIALVRGDRSNG